LKGKWRVVYDTAWGKDAGGKDKSGAAAAGALGGVGIAERGVSGTGGERPAAGRMLRGYAARIVEKL